MKRPSPYEVAKVRALSIILEGTIELRMEDGGRALVSENVESISDPRTFVRIQSWSDDGEHPELLALHGKYVRVQVIPIDAPKKPKKKVK